MIDKRKWFNRSVSFLMFCIFISGSAPMAMAEKYNGLSSDQNYPSHGFAINTCEERSLFWTSVGQEVTFYSDDARQRVKAHPAELAALMLVFAKERGGEFDSFLNRYESQEYLEKQICEAKPENVDYKKTTFKFMP